MLSKSQLTVFSSSGRRGAGGGRTTQATQLQRIQDERANPAAAAAERTLPSSDRVYKYRKEVLFYHFKMSEAAAPAETAPETAADTTAPVDEVRGEKDPGSRRMAE